MCHLCLNKCCLVFVPNGLLLHLLPFVSMAIDPEHIWVLPFQKQLVRAVFALSAVCSVNRSGWILSGDACSRELPVGCVSQARFNREKCGFVPA